MATEILTSLWETLSIIRPNAGTVAIRTELKLFKESHLTAGICLTFEQNTLVPNLNYLQMNAFLDRLHGTVVAFLPPTTEL